MSEQLHIPRYNIDDPSGRVEAARNFSLLGRTLPMITIGFDDIGRLSALDSDNPQFDGKQFFALSPGEHEVFRELVARAFQYVGADAQQLDIREFFAPPHFVPKNATPYAVLSYTEAVRHILQDRRSMYKNSKLHNDTHDEGPGATVYGVNLTAFGEGIIEADTAPGRMPFGKNKLHFGLADFPLRFRGELSMGDMQIFIRQAPSTDTYDISEGIIGPTTHYFQTIGEGGRVHIEASFGLASDYPLASGELQPDVA